jgi:hypothetical protein
MADTKAITWRGHDLDPQLVVDLVMNAFRGKRRTHARIKKVRSLRRKETTVKLAPSWQQRHPEHAAWITSILPERRTLERDLKARVGAVHPSYSCEPLGFTKRDVTYAEEKEHYLEEWRQSPSGPPVEAFFGKGVEDGEYGFTCLPSDLDMDGRPDFFETLTERAHAALDESERKQYTRLEGDRRGRYVKVDEKGRKKFNPTYDRDQQGRTRKQAGTEFSRDHGKSEEAHDAAVTRYLLERRASNPRLIPALDCAPVYARGVGQDRRRLVALCERATYDVEELLEEGFGWVGMPDRALVPRGADGGGQARGHQLTLYTAYLVSEDDDGHERPLICYAVGGPGRSGVGTWYAESSPDSEEQPKSLAVIDLYAKYGLQGALWGYFGGMRTDDDESDYEYEPYLWPFYELILGIEGNKTSINAANAVNSFPGYVFTPDAALAEKDPEAVVDANDQLRVPEIPAAGEIVGSPGPIVPFAPAQVGQDAWRVYQADTASLREATATEQPGGSDPSGHALVVQATIAQVAKRDIRDGALAATVFAGECHLKILHAIEKRHGVRWPIATTEERAIGEDMQSGQDVAEFDPAWLGDSVNTKLAAEYPEEENLSKIDLEMNLAERGFGSFEDVQKARAKKDALNERIKGIEDAIWRMPETQMQYALRVAKLRQDQVALQVLKLQQQQRMSSAGVPGMENGVPAAAIRPGQGAGGPSIAARVRGGVMAGEMGTAARQHDDAAALQVGGSAAPPAAVQGAA